MDKFVKHDALKSKLKNDLHNEYNEYLQKVCAHLFNNFKIRKKTVFN